MGGSKLARRRLPRRHLPCAGWIAAACGLALLGTPTAWSAAEPIRDAPRCAHHDPLRQPLFGDLHVHTAYSLDAAAGGTPRSAYEYARSGMRPLDFAAVTDHAEWLGEVRICTDPKHPRYEADLCWVYREQRPIGINLLSERTVRHKQRFEFCGPGARDCVKAAGNAWQDMREAADAFLDETKACRFTTFVAYEWTGTPARGINLHRNVVFADSNVPRLPTSYLDAASPRALWDALEDQCLRAKKPCDVLTIPHNSNLSDGLMFTSGELERPEDAGLPISRAEAERRRRLEPLVEIMQHKGDSECLPGGDTRDEACGFEKVPYNSFLGAMSDPSAWPSLPPRRSDTVREALKKGLVLESELGINPFRYGILGSTDTHTARPGSASERGFTGHTIWSAGAGPKERLPDLLQYNPGGLAVVWAEENSRASIFAAMKRREVYGTSGPRIVARFFGGWDFGDEICRAADGVAQADRAGVPMGGVLAAAARDSKRSPTFTVLAMQDPGAPGDPGTPLREIQIVKGWLEGDQLHEKVVTVVEAERAGSVDPKTCETSGSGAASLCRVWRDPDFDPAEPAFYYARVLENPTCRWSQRVCVEHAVDCAHPERIPPGLAPCCDPRHRPVVQERAWTSPIWYAPEAGTRIGRMERTSGLEAGARAERGESKR